ncbi:MAG: argininosuccinate lyase [Kiloniellaceae bacterium]
MNAKTEQRVTDNPAAETKTPGANSMWGGRFAAGPAAVMERINASIGFDQRLYAQDIAGSKAHCAMLVHQRIIGQEDGAAILAGLDRVLEEIEAGQFEFKASLEDIHMNVEARLSALIGEAAGRLHTARSRNDQVATDVRLWTRDAGDRLEAALRELQAVLIAQAEAEADSVMPGYTHLQAAQPVTFGHHMLAYVEMLGRDRGRLRDCRKRMNECPLGAAALAGTSFDIDRHATAAALDFDHPMANSIDAVSDRDYVLEYLAAGSILALHLSRLSEEIVLWCSAGFRFVTLSDAYTTGSSIMPQKRNPDAAELIRGKAGRVIGALNSLLIVMKGLPLSYGKDMQEDKEPLFDAADTLELCVAAMTGMIADMKANRANLKAATAHGFLTATDLADWLVRVLGMPFRQAHHVTGSIVKLAEDRDCGIEALALADMQAVEPGITEDIFTVLSVENAAASRMSAGGTAPERVREAVAAAKERFL